MFDELNGGRLSACALAALTLAGILAHPREVGAATIPVAPGGSLQAALDNARPGDTVVLTSGATYVGNFTLPVKSGSSMITIRTSTIAGLPGEGGRISPVDAALLAKIKSPNTMPAMRTAPGAHHWRLMLLEFLATIGGEGDIITLGDGSTAQSSLAAVPHDLVLDRVYVHGDSVGGQKRGIRLNSASTTVTGCYVSDIKRIGQDSQAIAGSNGPGPFTITNNHLEAAGENLMFGGADPAIPNLVPADIVIRGNDLSKPTSWRSQGWSVKNLLELKNARRVTIDDNTLEYNWAAGQSGFAVLFTVRNQSGGCTWCQVDHVTFERNVVRHVAAGINILGFDNLHPTQQTHAIVIRNNVFSDIDDKAWGGNGYFLILTGGPRDVTVDHNTIVQKNADGVVKIGGPPVQGFVFTNNIAKHGEYGIVGDNHRPGNDTIAAYLPGSVIARNVLAGGPAGSYPAGNFFPSEASFETQFQSYAGDDFRLAGSSPWCNAGTDGIDLGASVGAGLGTTAPPAAPGDLRIIGSSVP